ncbi:hypothetical protein CHH57_00230 [Niallia circulans]|uniref:Uncharacterized protein n=2 Tax=Niallia circulans TaxID=1397 RepID=A0AA91TX29_NIACI|nr:hypothetical protein CHH57_00230 [Niallia circulans]
MVCDCFIAFNRNMLSPYLKRKAVSINKELDFNDLSCFYISSIKEIKKMNNKIRISAKQMMSLLMMTIISTAILSIPAVTSKHAGHDMWVSPIFSSISGLITAFIILQLHKLYPNETIFQYSKHIVGTFLSKCIGLAYLLYILLVTSIIVREYADFILTSLLYSTPLVVIIGVMVILCAYSVKSGLEVFARASQVFLPIYIFSLLVLLLLFHEFDVKNMLPLFEGKWKSMLHGALQPALWFNQIFYMGILLPYVKDKATKKVVGYKVILYSLIVMFSLNIICLFLFGENVDSYQFPVFTAFRYIYIPPFFERFESVLVVIWVLGVFIKISLFYFTLCLGTAQWLGVEKEKTFVFPYGILIIIIALWVSTNLADLNKFIESTIPVLEIGLYVLIPLSLLLLSFIRKKRKASV